MPAARHHTAPKFSAEQPRELKRYFEELENLMSQAGITADAEKKKQAVRYLDVDAADMWKSLPTYATGDYQTWVRAVTALYPGADEERKWSIQDMDTLVGERGRLGVLNIVDFMTYYREFYKIATFLRAKGKISEAEESRSFIRGLKKEGSTLWDSISRRLEIKHPDHDPDDFWRLEWLRTEGEYVLRGTQKNLEMKSEREKTEPKVEVKPEWMAQMEVYFQNIQRSGAMANAAPRMGMGYGPGRDTGACNFCGEIGHYMAECEVVAQYTRDGKIKKNADGRIVLGTGAFVPRTIPGVWFKERVDEWHKRNPGNIIAAGLATVGNFMYKCVQPTSVESTDEVISGGALRLSTEERIDELERAILALRKQKFDGVEITHPKGFKPAADRGKAVPKESVEVPKGVGAKGKEPGQVEILKGGGASSKEEPKEKEKGKEKEEVLQIPKDPFANIPEAQYAPPNVRNFGAAPDKVPKDREPAYKTVAPFADHDLLEGVYDRILKGTKLTLSLEEILNISPDMRDKFRKDSTPKRVPIKEMNKVKAREVNMVLETELPFGVEDGELVSEGDLLGGFDEEGSSEETGIVCPDPYEVYLANLRPGDERKDLYVAKESHALRSIMMMVDKKENVECILDPGCQIVAMAEDVCHDLGLTYDPTIRLHMQSANGEVDQSLGLARNVPFQIGPITLFLQAHVLRAPAYQVLLGRPFDVLTQSIVKNLSEEYQTLTIKDPNTGTVATIPTIERGKGKRKVLEADINFWRAPRRQSSL